MSELDKLEKYLFEHGYEYDRIDEEDEVVLNRHQIIVYKNKKRQWDAVCQYGSYGYDQGLLEIYGTLVSKFDNKGDRVIGWLTAKEIIERIEG